MILMKEKVFFLARVSFPGRSSLCLGLEKADEKAINEERKQIFCFLAATFQHILAEIFG